MVVSQEKSLLRLAGTCLIVRRDVTETELFPNVSSLEVFDVRGKKRVYRESDFGIRRLDGYRVLTSVDKSWSVIPGEEEGMVFGFFHVSSNCEIKEVTLPHDGVYRWGDDIGGKFIDRETLQLQRLSFESSDGVKKKVNLSIKRN